MTQPKLQLVGIKKRLRGRQVLDGVDIDVAPGKSLVVIGGSGVGKSVTLKCALGLMKPDAGQVLVFSMVAIPGGLSTGCGRRGEGNARQVCQ